MLDLFETRTITAIALAILAVVAGYLVGPGAQQFLVTLVGAIAAVLVAGSGRADPEPAAEVAMPPPPSREPETAQLIEAIVEPLLIVEAGQVVAANRAARGLLGQHILDQDVRLAIRHPAAAERLVSGADLPGNAPIHLVGLGAREQRWEMRVLPLGRGQRVVHLIDRTGTYATERIRVDFVANASHELRTPLASLLGFIETLRDAAGEDPETRERFLKVMYDEARRMQRLVDDLMSLSRIEADKYRAPDKEVDLEALLDEVHAEIVATAHDRAADIVLDVEAVPNIRGDRAQLSQLVHNIVGNALKYGRSGTPVSISLRRDGDSMVRLSVVDEGEGIATEHLPRLTERFYRVDSGRSRAAGGTGLGLAIVKHIVERHRGRLDISSAVGRGTTVTVKLPTGGGVIKA